MLKRKGKRDIKSDNDQLRLLEDKSVRWVPEPFQKLFLFHIFDIVWIGHSSFPYAALWSDRMLHLWRLFKGNQVVAAGQETLFPGSWRGHSHWTLGPGVGWLNIPYLVSLWHWQIPRWSFIILNNQIILRTERGWSNTWNIRRCWRHRKWRGWMEIYLLYECWNQCPFLFFQRTYLTNLGLLLQGVYFYERTQ